MYIPRQKPEIGVSQKLDKKKMKYEPTSLLHGVYLASLLKIILWFSGSERRERLHRRNSLFVIMNKTRLHLSIIDTRCYVLSAFTSSIQCFDFVCHFQKQFDLRSCVYSLNKDAMEKKRRNK